MLVGKGVWGSAYITVFLKDLSVCLSFKQTNQRNISERKEKNNMEIIADKIRALYTCFCRMVHSRKLIIILFQIIHTRFV